MLISRGLAAAKMLKSVNSCNITRNMSGHAFVYRSGPLPHSKFVMPCATFFSSLMWWWIFWHLITDIGHVTGEFEYPDPRKWTNEELGIPPKN